MSLYKRLATVGTYLFLVDFASNHFKKYSTYIIKGLKPPSSGRIQRFTSNLLHCLAGYWYTL